MSRLTILSLGIAAVLGVTWLWHGPLGAGERLAAGIEARARAMLDHYEMVHVSAVVERRPLTRHVILSGPADDFQRSEIKRMIEEQPGVKDAGWSPSSIQSEGAQ